MSNAQRNSLTYKICESYFLCQIKGKKKNTERRFIKKTENNVPQMYKKEYISLYMNFHCFLETQYKKRTSFLHFIKGT